MIRVLDPSVSPVLSYVLRGGLFQHETKGGYHS